MSVDAYEPYDFANRRHIGPSPEEIAEMLAVLGVSNLDALIYETVPKDIRLWVYLDVHEVGCTAFARDRSLISAALL